MNYICIQLTAFLCFTSFSFVTSWTDRRKQQSEKVNLTVLFDKYVPPCLEVCRSRFRKITPIADIAHIHMLCHLLDCLVTPANTPADCPKEWYEIYFVFACVWAFGSALCQDQVCIHLECVSFLTSYCVHSLCRYSLPSYVKNESNNYKKFESLLKKLLCENAFYSLEEFHSYLKPQ